MNLYRPTTSPSLLRLDVKTLHLVGRVGLGDDAAGVESLPFAGIPERLAPRRRLETGWADQSGQLPDPAQPPLGQDRHRHDRRAGQQGAPALGREERAGLAVEHVELEEVVRQGVVEDGVLGVEPLAVEDVALAERGLERRPVALRPRLEQREVPLARAAPEVVAAALQQQLAIGVEADPGVRPVDLLLDDRVPAGQLAERHRREVLVAGLQPRALDVPRARVLEELCHRATSARPRRCGSARTRR
jgi:hypothetical protein